VRDVTDHVLEPAAQAIADATANPPYLYDIGPEAARKVLDDLQAAPVELLPVNERWVRVPAAVGDVEVRVVTPVGSSGALPVIVYMHGGGWILGNAATHDRLVRELSVGAGAALVFVEYTPSPEAKYPTAIEQGYAAAKWVTATGVEEGFDTGRIAVAGDSVGGNMAAALALMAKERGDVSFVQQSMYYPVTDAAQNTASYAEFAEGPYLRAASMKWFWDAYTDDPGQRDEITASPLRATLDQLRGLPSTLLLVDENDVLRDEGEASRSGSAGHRSALQRHHPRLHAAQSVERNTGDQGGGGAGDRPPENCVPPRLVSVNIDRKRQSVSPREIGACRGRLETRNRYRRRRRTRAVHLGAGLDGRRGAARVSRPRMGDADQRPRGGVRGAEPRCLPSGTRVDHRLPQTGRLQGGFSRL
jgi:acetyl esterase